MSKIKDYLLSKYEEGEVCDECGIEGEGATAWGGLCHDCDNQQAEVCDECGAIHDEGEGEVIING